MPIKKWLVISAILFIPFALLTSGAVVFADSLDEQLEEIENKLDKKQKEYESTSKKLSDIRDQATSVNDTITKLSSQLSVTQAEMNAVENQIQQMEAALAEINKNLTAKREDLKKKIELRNTIVRNFSKRGVLNDLEIFLTSVPASKENGDDNLNGFQYSAFSYIFEKSMTSQTISLIGTINKEITTFEKDKKEAEQLKADLENSRVNLVALQNQLASQKGEQEGVLGELEEKEGDLEGTLEKLNKDISELTEKQRGILSQKYGEGYGTVGNYEAESQKLPDPGFSPAFAVASYGAYTHRNGMSQYGAKGRANDGKDYKEIIKFYYKSGVKTKDDFPDKISVQGHGEMSFQKYLYGIAEMPSDWPMDALKAQAIAARTYAYKSNKPICTTESCQVYLKSKADNPPSRWKEAVDKTKDMILDGSSTSQYSSTTGGYINNVGWDIDGGSWPKDAYEKKAGSPWFFKAWYTQTYNNNSSTCGRSSPWLNEKEMADILNAWVVLEKGSSSDTDHISPLTTNCWGGDPYSMDEMASKADKYGNKFKDVEFVKVEISNGGYTSKVIFDTDKGRVSIDGSEFKTAFNLRAPGYISIRNKLFDIITE